MEVFCILFGRQVHAFSVLFNVHVAYQSRKKAMPITLLKYANVII